MPIALFEKKMGEKVLINQRVLFPEGGDDVLSPCCVSNVSVALMGVVSRVVLAVLSSVQLSSLSPSSMDICAGICSKRVKM
jgi:hypothetical protein